ncbi:hypothetical protein V2J09_001697 [Rumex salicifolius]
MCSLWKRLWESISNSKNSSSNFTNPNRIPVQTAIFMAVDPFDRLPEEILTLILIQLGPKEAAKLTLVCRSWRNSILSDNRLWVYFIRTYNPFSSSDPPWEWDSIFFSETHLRTGSPIQVYSDDSHSLCFMEIYGLRTKAPGSVLIDGIWMQVKTKTQPIVVSIPISNYDDTECAKASRKQLKQAIYATLFAMNVPAVCAVNQAILSLYAARRTSGILVNIGFYQTSVVPIMQGKIMRKIGVQSVGIGGMKLTEFLRDQMQLNNIPFKSANTVRELKENLCYVAYDYETELSKDTSALYEVSGEGSFMLSKERFKTGEILLRPKLAGIRAMGLDHAVALCMDHCLDAEVKGDDNWYKTVVLAGGTACLPGLAERLEKELHSLLPSSVSNDIRVIPPPYGADSAWFGAKLISSFVLFFTVVVEQFPWIMVHDEEAVPAFSLVCVKA